MDSENNKIWGKYKHFKGNPYCAYCMAIDKNGNQFVLYQQLYGDESFWIRPYEMFFGKVEFEGTLTNRFKQTSPKRTAKYQISQLISQLKTQVFYIRSSENDQLYCITNINENLDYICIHPIYEKQSSGYLTEHELADRMGYDLLIINDELYIHKKQEPIPDYYQLRIGNNNPSIFEQKLNPCSIDLQIAESGFLRAKFSSVDPQSIEHISNATSLWKEINLHTSKDQKNRYFKLRPGQTILTRTKERIRIPDDCAGKIEIKSTYARLSLSITSGDFCNPGYDGFFPLEIRNFGKHTVIIHAAETMAQLMLVPLSGPILVDYSQKATYRNASGYDDGTPYTFWQERAIKKLRKTSGAQPLIDLYERILANIKPENTPDITGFRERFKDTFLPFCQRRMHKRKFHHNGSPDLSKLVHAYINHENNIRKLFSIKWVTVIGLIISILSYIDQNSAKILPILIQLNYIWVIICSLLLTVTLFLSFNAPKSFCTFEGYDIDADIKYVESSTT